MLLVADVREKSLSSKSLLGYVPIGFDVRRPQNVNKVGRNEILRARALTRRRHERT